MTASAISRAERAERGASLGTLVRLSAVLGVTIDLLRGEDLTCTGSGAGPMIRSEASSARSRCSAELDSELHVDLVHRDVREAGAPIAKQRGKGIGAVASGLVQVQVTGRTPVRHGEVLVADSERVGGWRNLGQAEAVLFWIVPPGARSSRPRGLVS